MNADGVIARLRLHHAGDAVVLREAWGIDALAWGNERQQLAPHYLRIAYEVKVSRQDFRAELRKWPGKAQRALDFSHRYLFATPAGLLGPRDVADLPRGAGLIELHVATAEVVVEPATRQQVRELTAYDTAALVRYAAAAGRESERALPPEPVSDLPVHRTRAVDGLPLAI